MELIDYLEWLCEQNEKCLGCIYYKDNKCVRQSCHKLLAADGWVAMWTDSRNRNHGSWPKCMEWLEADTVIEDNGEFFLSDAKVKDQTFIWAKNSVKAVEHPKGACIAWRYKGVEICE